MKISLIFYFLSILLLSVFYMSMVTSPLMMIIMMVMFSFISFFSLYIMSKFSIISFIFILCTLGGIVIVYSFVLIELNTFFNNYFILYLNLFLSFLFLPFYFYLMKFEISSDISIIYLSLVMFVLMILNITLSGVNLSFSIMNFKMKKL